MTELSWFAIRRIAVSSRYSVWQWLWHRHEIVNLIGGRDFQPLIRSVQHIIGYNVFAVAVLPDELASEMRYP